MGATALVYEQLAHKVKGDAIVTCRRENGRKKGEKLNNFLVQVPCSRTHSKKCPSFNPSKNWYLKVANSCKATLGLNYQSNKNEITRKIHELFLVIISF